MRSKTLIRCLWAAVFIVALLNVTMAQGAVVRDAQGRTVGVDTRVEKPPAIVQEPQICIEGTDYRGVKCVQPPQPPLSTAPSK